MRTDRRPGPRVLLAAAVGMAAAVVVLVLALGGDDDGKGNRAGAPARGDAAVLDCALRGGTAVQRPCYETALVTAVGKLAAAPAVARVRALAQADRGLLHSDCHNLMHPVARRWAAARKVTLATLRENLPRGNDPGCTAGFTHGLLTHVIPQLDPKDLPGSLKTACDPAPTRYERYSCVHGFGHAFMRLFEGNLASALRFCTKIGDDAPDCAQGAFHDHWFAVAGLDAAKRQGADHPRDLCTTQPRAFVRACWYRAFIDTRPRGYRTSSARELLGPCGGLDAGNRFACVTATSVIGPAQPRAQLQLCEAAPETVDRIACVHGLKAQAIDPPDEDGQRVALMNDCRRLAGAATECYEWLGRIVNVLTDGSWRRGGCRRLAGSQARSACARGAARWREPLETFS